MTTSINDIGKWYSTGVSNPGANAYFTSYIQNATDSVSKIPQVGKTPTDVPLETMVALATYNPLILQGNLLQRPPQNLPAVQNALRQRLQQSNINVAKFSNFRPSVSGNAIQSKNRRVNGVLRNISARERVLAGLDPKTKKLVQDLQNLEALRRLEREMQRVVQLLEQEIARITGIFNALVNSIDAAASAALTVLIDKLDSLERAYTSAKNLLLLIAKTIANTIKAIRKALFEDIPNTIRRIRTGVDVLQKLLKLPEISLKLRFPKFPKFPRLTFTRADFFAKYKKLVQSIKDKNSGFYQKAYDMAIQQSGVELIDPKKDKIQQGLTKARNALKEARAQLQARQAARTNAINIARTDLIKNIRKNTAVTERERQRILDQNTAMQKRAKLAIANAARRVSDLAARRVYLTPTQERSIVPATGVNLTRTNVLNDLPFSRGDIAYSMPNKRIVYVDKRNNKLYILQTADERVRELAQNTSANISRNAAEFQAGFDTIKTAVASAAEVKNLLNGDLLKAQFGSALFGQAEQINNLQRQTNVAAQQSPETNQASQANANIVFESDTFTINAETKTITSTTRRFSASAAANQATNYNTTTAARNGYTIPLTIEASGPRSVNVNGQIVYEMVLSIGYKNFNPLNQARAEQLGQQPSATIFNPSTFSVGGPITSVPQSVLNAAQSGPPLSTLDRLAAAPTTQTFVTPSSVGAPITSVPLSVQETALNATLLPADRQQVEQLTNQINQIQQRLNQGINDDGSPISGEDRAALRAQQVALRDQITRIRNGRNFVPGINIPDNLVGPITPNIPLPQARLPQDRVEQAGPLIIVTLSRTDSPQGRNGLTIALEDARRLSRDRAAQTGLVGTPKTNAEYRQRGDISGRIVYELSFTADYTQPAQTSQEGNLAQRQLEVNILLQQGISPAEINARYSPPGPVDENGNIL